MLDNLITDRKESDVGFNSKGSYNVSDVNRVIDWTSYLNEQVNMTYLSNNQLQDISKVEYSTIPTIDYFKIYIDNLKSIINNETSDYSKDVLYENFMNELNINKANLIELILENIYNKIKYKNNYVYCYDETSPAIEYTQEGE